MISPSARSIADPAVVLLQRLQVLGRAAGRRVGVDLVRQLRRRLAHRPPASRGPAGRCSGGRRGCRASWRRPRAASACGSARRASPGRGRIPRAYSAILSPCDRGHRNPLGNHALSRGCSTCSCLRAKPAQAGDAEPRGPWRGSPSRQEPSRSFARPERPGSPMKPAWHEVVASLETSLARGSHGSHPANGANGTSSNSRSLDGRGRDPSRATADWHEPMADRPAAAPAIAAPSGRAELLASLERRMNREDEGIAVALVDLDGFKALNQDHGYAAGDQVLGGDPAPPPGRAWDRGIVGAIRLRRVRGPARRRGDAGRGRDRRPPGGRGLGADEPRRSHRPARRQRGDRLPRRPAMRGPRT